jgi:phosphate transport system substrate-binding protein
MKKNQNKRRAISQQTGVLGIIALLISLGAIYFAYSTITQDSEPNNNAATTKNNNDINNQLTGTIEIDGSSTVFPISEAVAEEFGKISPNVRINVGVSGTGGGFKRFIVGDTDINDASRPIKTSESETAESNDIEYLEIKVAIDGLAVMVNTQNSWVDFLTLDELKKIWEPESTVKRWSDIRPEWPERSINLYGPGTDSGTFDYFTSIIGGEEGASRPDYTASEDDNVLVRGISGDLNALGYFGFAFYVQNTEILKIVPIDSGNGPVVPSDESIKAGEYTPLSRPIFIYVNQESLVRPEVNAFIKFYLENAEQLVTEVGYTPFSLDVYQEVIDQIKLLN